MELALPLLDTIAPGIERPLAYRVGGSEPLLRQVPEDALLREAYHEAARLAREDGLVALIVPDELVEPALAHESAFDSIPLLTPREAKGLEFDHVIVVEPALVAEREQGLRELYVALTRPTTTLVVVYARPLPAELGLVESGGCPSSGHRGWPARWTTSSRGSTAGSKRSPPSTGSSRRWSRSSSPTARCCASRRSRPSPATASSRSSRTPRTASRRS